MQHPNLIREIDALIDSYNWEGLDPAPDSLTKLLKDAYHTQSSEIFFQLYSSTSRAQFFLFQLFAQLLQHPRAAHKQWILESMTHLTTVTRRQQNDSAGLALEKRRFFKKTETLLRRYTKHRITAYRCLAVIALAQLMPNHNQVIGCYVDAIRRERSFQNIFRIFEYLGAVFHKHPSHLLDITPQTNAAVMQHLESLQSHHSPLMRLEACALMIQMLQKKTPQQTLDCVAANWSFLDARKERHWHVMGSVVRCIFSLGKAAFRDLLGVLLVNNRTFIPALAVWQEIEQYHFVTSQDTRLITFTHAEKMLVEALLCCKPLWRMRRVTAPAWYDGETLEFCPSAQGLETTRAALIQQVKHAYLIDEMERFPDPADINLISYPPIDP